MLGVCSVLAAPLQQQLQQPDRDPAAHATAETAWSYAGEHAAGPGRWGDVWPLCGAGTRQSPVNLSSAEEVAVAPGGRAGGSGLGAGLKVWDLGCAVQGYGGGSGFAWVADTAGCKRNRVTYLGKRWQLQQFHFHAPAEHSVDGVFADAEMHMVHAAPDGSLMVIALLLSAALAPAASGDDTLLRAFLSEEAFADPGRLRRAGGLFYPYLNLVPHNPEYLSYTGSLTTPPCTEGVEWVVFREHVPMTHAQLARHATSSALCPLPSALCPLRLPCPLPSAPTTDAHTLPPTAMHWAPRHLRATAAQRTLMRTTTARVRAGTRRRCWPCPWGTTAHSGRRSPSTDAPSPSLTCTG